MKTWFDIKAKANDTAEIYIYDDIGAFGLTAKDFIVQLKALPKTITNITVRINSYGGEIFDAFAIYNALVRHSASVTAIIDGIAASAASVVAMAASKVVMPGNSFLMIHRSWGVVIGNTEDMTEWAETMKKFDQSIASIYAKKTGKPIEEIETMMSDETWLNAVEAKEMGFADEISEAIQLAARASMPTFEKMPEALRLSITPPSSSPPTPPKKTDDSSVEPGQRMYLSKAEAKVIADAQKILDEQADKELCRAINRLNGAIVQARLDAGHPELAVTFINRSLSLDQVKAELLKPENISSATPMNSAEEAKKIIALVMKAGVPELLEKFVAENRTVVWVEDRLKHADAIRARCAAGKMPERGNGYIIANLTPSEVGNHLLELKCAMQGPEIDHYQTPDMILGVKPQDHANNGNGRALNIMSAQEIYRMRNRRPDVDAEKIIAVLKGVLRR